MEEKHSEKRIPTGCIIEIKEIWDNRHQVILEIQDKIWMHCTGHLVNIVFEAKVQL